MSTSEGRYSLRRVNLLLAVLDVFASSFVFSATLCLLWFVPHDRWLSFYRDLTFRHVTNYMIETERNYADFVEAFLHAAALVAVVRMVAAQLLVVAVLLRKLWLVVPFLAWNAASILFAFVTLLSFVIVNDDRDMGSVEFEDFNTKFLVACGLSIAFLLGFQVAAVAEAKEIGQETVAAPTHMQTQIP